MKTIKTFFMWLLYWFVTKDDRILYSLNMGEYQLGSRKRILRLDAGVFTIGQSYTYAAENTEPERNYLTWSEFWEKYG